MLKCKLKVLFIARSSDMQNLGKNLNLTAFQTRSPSDERDAAQHIFSKWGLLKDSCCYSKAAKWNRQKYSGV